MTKYRTTTFLSFTYVGKDPLNWLNYYEQLFYGQRSLVQIPILTLETLLTLALGALALEAYIPVHWPLRHIFRPSGHLF